MTTSQTLPDDSTATEHTPCPSIHEGCKSYPSPPTQRNGPYSKPAPAPDPSTGIPRKTFFPPPTSFVHIGDTVRQYSVHPLPPSAMPDADRINFQQQPLIKNTENRRVI